LAVTVTVRVALSYKITGNTLTDISGNGKMCLSGPATTAWSEVVKTIKEVEKQTARKYSESTPTEKRE
jgi:hypothetical protein